MRHGLFKMRLLYNDVLPMRTHLLVLTAHAMGSGASAEDAISSSRRCRCTSIRIMIAVDKVENIVEIG
jgi:hypothetical protein